VVDLTTNKITKKIPVQKGAEKLVVIGTDVYVGSVGGFLSSILQRMQLAKRLKWAKIPI